MIDRTVHRAVLPISIALLAGLACSLSMVAAAVANADRSLLSRSTRIVVDDRTMGKSEVDIPWLSDHQILHFVTDSDLFCYDLKTRKDVRLLGMSIPVTLPGNVPWFVDASSDGNGVIAKDPAGGLACLMSTKGKVQYLLPNPGFIAMPYWYASGSRWIEMPFYMQGPGVDAAAAKVNDAADRNWTRTISPLPLGMRQLQTLGVVSDRFVVMRVPDRETHSKPMPIRAGRSSPFVVEIKMSPQTQQQISVWDLHVAHVVSEHNIVLPAPVYEVAVSRDGKYLAWLLCSGPGSIPLRYSLYVSALNGAHLHSLGYVDCAGASTIFDQVNWSPDGKRISFRYRKSLWVIPVSW